MDGGVKGDAIDRRGGRGPLAGLKVVELQGIGPGPFAGMFFADLGAQVISVGRPGGLDVGLGTEACYDLLRRNRPVITLDLKRPEGVDAFLRLADRADVLLEPFRPGVAERLGIGPEVCCERNAALVYARMTGWGQNGPLAKTAGHDINYLALTGILNAIGPAGGKPAPPLNLVGDMGGGAMFLIAGVLAALLERASSGRGQVLDASIADGAAYLAMGFFGSVASGAWSLARGENSLDGGAPFYDTYETADGGHVAVGAIEDKFFRQLLDGLGLDQTWCARRHDRAQWPALKKLLAETFRQRTRDEWCEIFADSDACVSPVLSFEEAPAHPQYGARASFLTLNGIRQPAPAPRFGRSATVLPQPPSRRDWPLERMLRDWGVDPGDVLFTTPDAGAARRAAGAARSAETDGDPV